MVGILADDLTSAIDAAAPFAERGLSARIILNGKTVPTVDGVDVVAIDLDTRFASKMQAEARFETAAVRLASRKVLYKTMDSTLRGNVGNEVRGALRGAGRTFAIVAPAFPAEGRTTIGGHQFVHDIPVEQSVFARDPRTPVISGRVADYFACVNKDQWAVHDAESDRDLDQVVAKIGLNTDVLWVGSPGLGAALARVVRPKPSMLLPEKSSSARVRRVLVVVGSLHPVNEEQVLSLTNAGSELVEIDNTGFDIGRYSDLVDAAFARSMTVCIRSPRIKKSDSASSAEALANRIATCVAAISHAFDGLVLTGGNTARRVADRLCANSIDIVGEIEPGVARGFLLAPGQIWPIATKAGGFGNQDTLLRSVEQLRAK